MAKQQGFRVGELADWYGTTVRIVDMCEVRITGSWVERCTVRDICSEFLYDVHPSDLTRIPKQRVRR